MATECKTKSNDTDSKVQRKKEQLTKYKKEKGKTKRKKEITIGNCSNNQLILVLTAEHRSSMGDYSG
jgi:hypothetical protein